VQLRLHLPSQSLRANSRRVSTSTTETVETRRFQLNSL
jgi:hypothetical protein